MHQWIHARRCDLGMPGEIRGAVEECRGLKPIRMVATQVVSDGIQPGCGHFRIGSQVERGIEQAATGDKIVIGPGADAFATSDRCKTAFVKSNAHPMDERGEIA
ncbi:hypothetical protein ASF27_15330 [Methylobacterium sp. Leaf102]|nr:hypothetical protein ASF27_15330 [Methylobacterium sp. Leaf102]